MLILKIDWIKNVPFLGRGTGIQKELETPLIFSVGLDFDLPLLYVQHPKTRTNCFLSKVIAVFFQCFSGPHCLYPMIVMKVIHLFFLGAIFRSVVTLNRQGGLMQK